jgi:hypothetical protein
MVLGGSEPVSNHDTRTPVEIITDSVNQLVRSRINREDYIHITDLPDWRAEFTPKTHETNVPSLLDQLHSLLEPGGIGDAGRSHPASRPAFRAEAHDVLLGIDRAVQMWLRYNNLTSRHNLEGDLRQLVGATGTMLDHAVYNLSLEARQWATRARIATAWEAPARHPHNSCPLCGQYGTLRLRLDVVAGTGEAMCVACDQAWDEFNIGLLAAHIRWENSDVDEDGTGAAS